MKNVCQSCGMPLKFDPEGGGTEKDGRKSADFCSYCYVKGAYTDSFSSALEMQSFVQSKLREMGYGRFMAWLFSRGIPRLKRWR